MTFELLLFYISLFFLLIFILNVSLNSFFAPFLNRINFSIKNYPKVSVLIPLRNEEKNVKNVINSILNQDYPNYELIVLNDNSTDDTLKILNEINSDNSFKILSGKELRKGWLGKNHACHQLSKEASGEILIFTDADNIHKISAISNTVKYINKYKLDFLSAFPQQLTHSFSEKLIVPFIDVILYSLLFLKFNFWFKNPAFAAANGQWIAVKKDSYLEIGGHISVKDKVVEDVSLCRNFKILGKKVMTLSGKGIVFGKMYSKFSEIWEGLSKNIFGLTGFKLFPFLMLLSVFLLTALYPVILFFLNIKLSLILIAFLILWKIIFSFAFGYNKFINVFLHPFTVIIIAAIGINSVIKYYTGGLRWKGRKINLN